MHFDVPLASGSLRIDMSPLQEMLRKAGRRIEEVQANRGEDGRDVQTKGDGSPVTAADLAANAVLLEGLATHWPDVPVVSEETWRPGHPIPELAWVVDPLDGTKEFIKRNGEYVVNVGLMEGARPLFGAVHVPTTGDTFVGGSGLGAWRLPSDGEPQQLACAPFTAGTLRVVASRSHAGPLVESFLERIGGVGLKADRVPMGSAWKLVLVAEDRADCYPRLGPTMWWDTCAPQAVVEGAGGRVLDAAGRPFRYILDGDGDPRNGYFLVLGAPGAHDDKIIDSFTHESGSASKA